MNPQVFSCLHGKDVLAFGTGTIGKRMIPYLAQDPAIKLHGVTNSRITADDDGTFLETELPIRSVQTWAKILPDATIFILAFNDIDTITTFCSDAGFQKFQVITGEMMEAFTRLEDQIAELELPRYFSSICLANELHDAHRSAFSEFKACNRGRTVAVVATGPTLRHYTQISGVTHIGVNSSFLKKNLVLDYYFICNYVPEWLEKLASYPFVKFFGINRNANSIDQFPEYIIEENGGRRFFSTLAIAGTDLHSNIEYYPLMGFNSVVFPAIHFALYTHPKRLLLVGCDCEGSGHFNDTTPQFFDGTVQLPQWIGGHRKVKKFAAIHYPDTEIVSVNPVGLKGLFHDVYTESYLAEHPEIDRTVCEIIKV